MPEVAEEDRRRNRNCDEESNQHFSLLWMDGHKRCPHASITPEAMIAIGWRNDFKRFGALPYGGRDIMKQPAWVFEAIKAADDAAIEAEQELSKRQHEEEERKAAERERQAKRESERKRR